MLPEEDLNGDVRVADVLKEQPEPESHGLTS